MPASLIMGAALISTILGMINFVKSIIFFLKIPGISSHSIKLRFLWMQVIIIVMMFFSVVMIGGHLPETPYYTDLYHIVNLFKS